MRKEEKKSVIKALKKKKCKFPCYNFFYIYQIYKNMSIDTRMGESKMLPYFGTC